MIVHKNVKGRDDIQYTTLNGCQWRNFENWLKEPRHQLYRGICAKYIHHCPKNYSHHCKKGGELRFYDRSSKDRELLWMGHV